MNRLDPSAARTPFTPPTGHGPLNGGAGQIPDGPSRPANRNAIPPPASFSPVPPGMRAGPSAFLLPPGDSSFSIMRDDPEASRSGLLGMSPLVFRAATNPQYGGAAVSLGSPGPSRTARAPGSMLGLMNPVMANVLPSSLGGKGSTLPDDSSAVLIGDEDGQAGKAAMLQRMRMWRTDAMHHHLYDSAIFWGDKVLSLEETELAWNDAYWLAQAYFMTHQYTRAEHLLTRPLRSAHSRRLAEEQRNSAGLAAVDSNGVRTQLSGASRKEKNDPTRKQAPRAMDVIGVAISRARETAVLPRYLLDKLPPNLLSHTVDHPILPVKANESDFRATKGKDPVRSTLFPTASGMPKAASSSSLAGKRKDRTFTVSGTGTASSIGENDGENGSIESGNSGSAGGNVDEQDGNELDRNMGKFDADMTSGSQVDEVEEWHREDAQNLKDIADRKLAAFDGPVLANNSLACRCLAAQCQVRLGKYYEALDTLGGSEAPWNIKARDSDKDPAADGGIKLGSTAYFLRGQIYLRLDDLDKAKESFMNALAIDVKNYEAFCALVSGNLLSVLDQWSFVKTLEYAAQSGAHPEDGEFIRLMYISRLPKQAPEHLAEASSSRRALMTQYKVQDNADVLWGLAEELFSQMRYADAFTITSRIMELSKDHEGALPIHVTCMFNMPKMRPALFMLAHRLVEEDPESPAAWYAVGAWYGSAGRWAEARRYFSKATLLDPRFAPSWIAFAHSFAKEGESDQAVTAYATAARKFPYSHLPKLFIGMEHIQQTNYKLAGIFLRGALKAAPKDPLVLNELGVLEYLCENPSIEKAISLFEEALAVVEQVQEPAAAWTVTHMNLAFALRQAGRDEEAKTRFLRAIELEPTSIPAHVGVGMCEHKQGKLSAAIAWYHDALAMNPRDTFCTTLLEMALQESLMTPKQSAANGFRAQ